MASTKVEVPRPTQGPPNGRAAQAVAGHDVRTAAHQAFWQMRITFTIAPFLFGIDKFFTGR
jgi:hypothetical protein